MIVVSLVGMVGFSLAGNAVSTLQATANATNGTVGTLQATVNDGDGVPARAKMYYLTATGFTGGEAITACDSKYHMASISEIQAAGNLQYFTRHTPAYDSADGMTAEEAQKWYRTPALGSSAYDYGMNPPTDHMGWVRTAAGPLTGSLEYNYDLSSYSDQRIDTAMSLHYSWGDSYMDPFLPSPPSLWHLVRQSSSLREPVWCVEDPESTASVTFTWAD